MPEWFVIWAQFDFGTRVPSNQLASFLPSMSQSKPFYLCWNVPFKIIGFFLSSATLMDQKCQEMLLVLTCQVIENHISSVLPAGFSINRNFFTRGGLVVFKYCEVNSLHRNLSFDWAKVVKILFVLTYLVILTRLLRELQIWILVSRTEFTVIFFMCCLEGAVPDCVPKCKRVHLTFIFRRF